MSPSPQRLATAARDLLDRPDPTTAGLWPRAAALLARQALERALEALWLHRAPGLERCTGHAQMLCLPTFLRTSDGLAERVAYTWSGLSHACHHHAYELPPTSTELLGWIATVDELVAYVERLEGTRP